MSLTLLIGNKNYSSWSMRPWVLLTQAGIPFTEHMVRFDSFDAGSHFRQTIDTINPVGKVPELLDNTHLGPSGQPLAVWDTLAIAEYVSETFPDKQLWPSSVPARARARSVCAEAVPRTDPPAARPKRPRPGGSGAGPDALACAPTAGGLGATDPRLRALAGRI